MGSGYIRKCGNCGYKHHIIEGIGMMDYYGWYFLPPSNKDSRWKDVIKSKRILKEIEEIIVNYSGKLYQETIDNEKIGIPYVYGWKEYYSNEEKVIYNLFHFKLEYLKDGVKKIYEPIYYDKHRKPLRILGETEYVNDVCPKCGSEFDMYFEFVNWD